MSSKTLSIISIVVGVYVLFWEPEIIIGSVRVATRFGFLIFAFILAYQAFDGFRSALLGCQSRTSAPDANPAAMGNRVAGMFLGVIFGGISVLLFAFFAGIIGPFSS